MRVRELSAAVVASASSLVVAGLALAAAVACSSSSSDTANPVAPGVEGGSDAQQPEAAVDAPFTGPTQKGRIIDAVGKTGVVGAVVSIGGKSITTNDDGSYAISITKDVPTSMAVTEPDHFKLNEQEWIVKSDLFDRGDTSLLSTSTAGLLASFLPTRDPTKGLLAVRIYPLPPCVSEAGSTLAIEPAGAAKLTYFAGGLPSKTAKATSKDESFSGIFTDVEPGVPIKVIVTSPICEQVAFPVDYGGVTLTGVQKAEPGDVVSYIRVFLGPNKIADSGAD
jgi:hypothetical protein